MKNETFLRPRALIIVPAEHGTAMTGDRVMLRHLLLVLGKVFECRTIAFARTGRVCKSLNALVHLLPPELAAYRQDRYRHRLRSAWLESEEGFVFILHEGLFYLADELDLERTCVTLFAHNVLSRFTIDSIAQPLLSALSRRYERRWYGKPGVRLVFISKGDRDEAVRLGIASADALIATPGAPVASNLASDAVFSGEAVITGTYDWWRKRRDLQSFAATGSALEPTAFDPRVAEVIRNADILRSMEDVDWSGAIRAGIITDRFAGGFKLKSLEYVARNCIVFSRARLFEDFEGLPYAGEFVLDQLDESGWVDRIVRLKSADQNGLRQRFEVFKEACLSRYDWATCLDPLIPEMDAP